jgi:beta-lactam-binding protein with PASTA domain
MSMEDAFRTLASARLRLGSVEREELPQSREIVLRQTPQEGETVPLGSEVTLVIAHDTSVAQPLVTVPNIVGKLQTEASILLAAAGLRQGGTRAEAAQRPIGEVLFQTPAAGVQVPLTTAVELVVATTLSAQLIVPDLRGRRGPDVDTLIAQAGLMLGTITPRSIFLPPFFRPAGTVIEQAPAPGTPLGAPVAINLIVAAEFPIWIIPPLLLLAGTLAGFVIYRRDLPRFQRSVPTRPPPFNVTTRVFPDRGYQHAYSPSDSITLEIRIRPHADPGTQSVREVEQPSRAARTGIGSL